MAIVCIDTSVLLPLFMQNPAPSNAVSVARAQQLIEDLIRQKATMIIPSIVLAETIMQIPENHLAAFTSLMERNFQIIPFDALAALSFRKIYNGSANARTEMKGEGCNRKALTADLKILATALSRQATTFYTQDKKLVKLASQYFDVKDLPAVPPKQLPLQ